MTITIKQITLCFLFLFICIGVVGAIDLTTGSASSDKSSVILSAGSTVFEDTRSGLSVSTTTKIDGVVFTPAFTVADKELIWSSGELSNEGISDPKIQMIYTYTGNTIKEVIILKEDKQLSFPITLSPGSKMIPWYNGQWKIVDKYSGNTMVGIILEKPYGIDALGNRIEMEYKYTKGILTLEYNRTIVTYDSKETKDIFPTPEEIKIIYSDITYPLTIDPTWTVVGDHYEYNISNNYIFMWNSTGVTNWTVPTGVSSIWVLVVAGGGGGGSWNGGGGGAGGLINTTINVDDNTKYNITVGDGGSGGANLRIRGNNGGNSSFFNITFNITSNGGGGGASYSLDNKSNLNGSNGGSGGGQTYAEAAYYHPGNGTAGQGYGGGWGSNVGTGAGGGGGSSELGINGTNLVGGKGGNGSLINITRDNIYYAGGGGGAVAFGGTQSVGGLGGGGKGCHGDATNSTPGENGLGGGGGGGYDAFYTPWTAYGQNGGSGVIIISYFLPPIANFTTDNTTACMNQKVQFNDTSLNAPTSWGWDFGNTIGNSTLQNPNYTYTSGGVYTITLNATNTGGSNITIKPNYITVNDCNPVANFTADNTTACINDFIQFIDTSTQTPTGWNWSFGDTITNITKNPLHQYTTEGNFTVSLNVSNLYGNTSITKSNYIHTASCVPPASITNLSGVITMCGAVIWNWTDPVDVNLDHILVYINNVFVTNVTNGTQHYNMSGRTYGNYTISTKTANSNGNENTTWVNNTVAGVINCPPSSGGGMIDDTPIIFGVTCLLIGVFILFYIRRGRSQ